MATALAGIGRLRRVPLIIAGTYALSGLAGINEWASIWLKRNYYAYYGLYLLALLAGAGWMCWRCEGGRRATTILTGMLIGSFSGWLAALVMPGVTVGFPHLQELLANPASYWQAAVFAGLVLAWAGGLIMGALVWMLEADLPRGLEAIGASLVLAVGVEVLRQGLGWDWSWIRF